jgi:hypothetical protein
MRYHLYNRTLPDILNVRTILYTMFIFFLEDLHDGSSCMGFCE